MLYLFVLSLLWDVIAAQEKFLWGTATAAYQIEGAVKRDGRLPSIWDTFSHTPGKTANGATGDIADDDYDRYAEDIDLLANLTVDSYRFSIAWPRILPDGKSVNRAGIMHYQKVLDILERKNIIPFVTLYHWDLPQILYDETNGGWINESLVDPFVRYATTCFSAFGNRVKHWITFNEPLTFCQIGYGVGVHAPGRCSDRTRCSLGNSGTEPYLCGHTLLLAHAAAAKVYHDQFQPTQNGIIGITLSGDWAEPMTASIADKAAAQRYLLWQIGWFADAVFKGDYPPEMRLAIGSRLPMFTAQQSKDLMSSSDYYGMNEYTAKWVANKPNKDPPSWGADQQNDVTAKNYNGTQIGKPAASSWLYDVPWGIYKLLHWISDRYNHPPIFITENGVDCVEEINTPLPQVLHDKCRIAFYSGYLNNVLKAKSEGVNVRGYFAWSLMDNYEWADGYSKRFGLIYVDYKNNITRHPKDSYTWYKNFIQKNRNV